MSARKIPSNLPRSASRARSCQYSSVLYSTERFVASEADLRSRERNVAGTSSGSAASAEAVELEAERSVMRPYAAGRRRWERPAMPLLRRPHDHRRELRARRRTPRPAIARSRGQRHDAMTPITPSSTSRLPANPASAVASLLPRRLQRHAPCRRSCNIAPSTAAAAPNSRLGSSIRRRRPRPAHPLPKPPPRQIPIDREAVRRVPAGSFLGGFRTPALITRG
jgi:hypothetical protein